MRRPAACPFLRRRAGTIQRGLEIGLSLLEGMCTGYRRFVLACATAALLAGGLGGACGKSRTADLSLRNAEMLTPLVA